MHRILDKKKSLIICENNYKLAEISDFLERNSKENFFIFKEFETLPYDHFLHIWTIFPTVLKLYQNPQTQK